MPLVSTPAHFRQRADLYHQLGQLVTAGMGLVQALQHLQRNPPARSYRAPLAQTLELITRGDTLSEAWRQTDRRMPAFDLALVQAGEQSGHLDSCFRWLANYYNDRARIARRLIVDLAYPVLLLHAAVFIFPFAAFFTSGNWRLYLMQTLGVLIPLYFLVILLLFAMESHHSETWRSLVEAVLNPIPVLGTGRRSLALSRLAAALEALLSAGVNIVEAWNLAAAASGSPAVRRTVRAWKSDLLAGQTPAELVRESRVFPDVFSNLYTTGEVTGKLDESLGGLHRYYQDEGTRKLHAVAQWTPRLIYGGVALLIAYRVVVLYMGHIQAIRDAGGF